MRRLERLGWLLLVGVFCLSFLLLSFTQAADRLGRVSLQRGKLGVVSLREPSSLDYGNYEPHRELGDQERTELKKDTTAKLNELRREQLWNNVKQRFRDMQGSIARPLRNRLEKVTQNVFGQLSRESEEDIVRLEPFFEEYCQGKLCGKNV
jgi:hypothetical protein